MGDAATAALGRKKEKEAAGRDKTPLKDYSMKSFDGATVLMTVETPSATSRRASAQAFNGAAVLVTVETEDVAPGRYPLTASTGPRS